MSRCEKCGAKDHSTLGHEAALATAEVWSPPSALEALLLFERGGRYGSNVLVANVQRPFKPRGLMLLSATLIGNTDGVVLASFGKLPARWFTVSQSFDQVREAIAAGNEPGQGWGDWSSLYPGIQVRLLFEGDPSAVQALMWGHALT